MKILTKENLTRIGFVNKTSGFKGNVSCIVDMARPEKLLNKKFLFILLEGLPVPFAIEEIEQRENDLLVKFVDVDSETEAKKLLRKEIYTEKQRAQKKSDILSWFDLKGFTAIDEVAGELGKIEEVMELPQQMIAKCIFNGKEILFPLNEDIIIDINEKENILYVKLPDGLIDIYM